MAANLPVSTVVCYAFSLFNFLCFLLALLRNAWASQTEVENQHSRQRVMLKFILGVICEYIIQIFLILGRSLILTTAVINHHEIIYLLLSTFTWMIQYIVLEGSRFPIWDAHYTNWAIATLLETFLLLVPIITYKRLDDFDCILISLQFLRIHNLIALLCLCLVQCSKNISNHETECQPLLADQRASAHCAATLERDDEEDDHLELNASQSARSWWDHAKEFQIFLPYLWPDEKHLQLKAVLLVFYPFVSNALNLLVPRQLGIVYDTLTSGNGTRIYSEIIVWGVLLFLNSDVGIRWLKFYLWKPVQLHGYKAINAAAHFHVMQLSADFHERKEPQAILHDINQGQSITSLVDKVCFNLLPILIDLCTICGYLYQLFGAYMALIVSFTTLFYLYTTTRLLKRAAPALQDYTKRYRMEWRSGHSAIDSWSLASLFDNIEYEHNQYVSNMEVAGKYRRDYVFGMSLISASQSSVMNLGQIAGCFLAVFRVRNGINSDGDLAVFLSYWAQLNNQLSFLNNGYTSIFEEMIKAIRLIGIFKTTSSILDKDNAQPLQVKTGEVKFKNVHFRYIDKKDTLKGVSFVAPSSQIVGIVGESRSGKSTLVKLLTRFYDVKRGSIEIDGQDVHNVRLESLRKEIAVVSQDPTVFNDSIMNNMCYAKKGASCKEVYAAYRSAAIHDKIMSFPNGYDTRVGNRGMKLSGGEKQRIAIAHGILKGCRIIMLDEATSSIDTKTEQLIQKGLDTIFLGCTVFIIAHRLSTIRETNLIVVIENGVVVEQGTHDKLLTLKRKYYELWDAQTRKKVENEATAIVHSG